MRRGLLLLPFVIFSASPVYGAVLPHDGISSQHEIDCYTHGGCLDQIAIESHQRADASFIAVLPPPRDGISRTINTGRYWWTGPNNPFKYISCKDGNVNCIDAANSHLLGRPFSAPAASISPHATGAGSNTPQLGVQNIHSTRPISGPGVHQLPHNIPPTIQQSGFIPPPKTILKASPIPDTIITRPNPQSTGVRPTQADSAPRPHHSSQGGTRPTKFSGKPTARPIFHQITDIKTLQHQNRILLEQVQVQQSQLQQQQIEYQRELEKQLKAVLDRRNFSQTEQQEKVDLLMGPMGICPTSTICVHWQLCKNGFVIADGSGFIDKTVGPIPKQIFSTFEGCGDDMICCGISPLSSPIPASFLRISPSPDHIDGVIIRESVADDQKIPGGSTQTFPQIFSNPNVGHQFRPDLSSVQNPSIHNLGPTVDFVAQSPVMTKPIVDVGGLNIETETRIHTPGPGSPHFILSPPNVKPISAPSQRVPESDHEISVLVDQHTVVQGILPGFNIPTVDIIDDIVIENERYPDENFSIQPIHSVPERPLPGLPDTDLSLNIPKDTSIPDFLEFNPPPLIIQPIFDINVADISNDNPLLTDQIVIDDENVNIPLQPIALDFIQPIHPLELIGPIPTLHDIPILSTGDTFGSSGGPNKFLDGPSNLHSQHDFPHGTPILHHTPQHFPENIPVQMNKFADNSRISQKVPDHPSQFFDHRPGSHHHGVNSANNNEGSIDVRFQNIPHPDKITIQNPAKSKTPVQHDDIPGKIHEKFAHNPFITDQISGQEFLTPSNPLINKFMPGINPAPDKTFSTNNAPIIPPHPNQFTSNTFPNFVPGESSGIALPTIEDDTSRFDNLDILQPPSLDDPFDDIIILHPLDQLTQHSIFNQQDTLTKQPCDLLNPNCNPALTKKIMPHPPKRVFNNNDPDEFNPQLKQMSKVPQFDHVACTSGAHGLPFHSVSQHKAVPHNGHHQETLTRPQENIHPIPSIQHPHQSNIPTFSHGGNVRQNERPLVNSPVQSVHTDPHVNNEPSFPSFPLHTPEVSQNNNQFQRPSFPVHPEQLSNQNSNFQSHSQIPPKSISILSGTNPRTNFENEPNQPQHGANLPTSNQFQTHRLTSNPIIHGHPSGNSAGTEIDHPILNPLIVNLENYERDTGDAFLDRFPEDLPIKNTIGDYSENPYINPSQPFPSNFLSPQDPNVVGNEKLFDQNHQTSNQFISEPRTSQIRRIGAHDRNRVPISNQRRTSQNFELRNSNIGNHQVPQIDARYSPAGRVPHVGSITETGLQNRHPSITPSNQRSISGQTRKQPGSFNQVLSRPSNRPNSFLQPGPAGMPMGMMTLRTPLGTPLLGDGGMCSASSYCVFEQECNPHNGFIIMDPDNIPEQWRSGLKVPKIRCLVPGGIQRGVCCQLPHPLVGPLGQLFD